MKKLVNISLIQCTSSKRVNFFDRWPATKEMTGSQDLFRRLLFCFFEIYGFRSALTVDCGSMNVSVVWANIEIWRITFHFSSDFCVKFQLNCVNTQIERKVLLKTIFMISQN